MRTIAMKVLLISTYELGLQPFRLASPAARLAEAGVGVSCLDLAVESLDDEAIRATALAHEACGLNVPDLDFPETSDASIYVPCLSEPRYCCAEPTENQLTEF
jgi:hypothetical protein